MQAAARQIDALGATRADADLTDAIAVQEIIAAVNPRLVVNCAAYTAVDKAESETAIARRVNVVGASNVARAAAAACVPLVHLSTDYVFDGTKLGAYVEDDLVAPINIYGRTKADGEAEVRTLAPQHIILRTAWTYGRFGHNFLKTILRLVLERPHLHVVADQKGYPTATQDLAEAIFAIDRKVSAGATAAWGTYHFAGSGSTNWCEFAETIVAAQARVTGLRPPVTPIETADYPTPARRPANSQLDSQRFVSVFGYRAVPWRGRVTETIEMLLYPSETQ
jgi:dTDP-4-dehydrorhamnose reductase